MNQEDSTTEIEVRISANGSRDLQQKSGTEKSSSSSSTRARRSLGLTLLEIGVVNNK